MSRQIVKTNSQIKWNDVLGNEYAKQILNESVVLPLKYPQLFTDLTRPWKGILLHGVSGVGKTLLAKALNAETFESVTFFNISASTMISKWRGESEKFVKVMNDFNDANRQMFTTVYKPFCCISIGFIHNGKIKCACNYFHR